VIDVWGVVANSLWILGLAVLLAVLSWANWAASVEKVRLRTALTRPGVQRALNLGLFLFCAGLAATGRAWWERVLWGLLAVAWVVQAWLAGRRTEDAGEGRDAG
jgi:CHASE2 domain-containing sensor protein